MGGSLLCCPARPLCSFSAGFCCYQELAHPGFYALTPLQIPPSSPPAPPAAEEKQRQQQVRNVLNAGRSLSQARLSAALGGSRGRSPGSNGSSRGASPAALGAGPAAAGAGAGALLQDKVLVFSQWTAMLGLMEQPLRQEG